MLKERLREIQLAFAARTEVRGRCCAVVRAVNSTPGVIAWVGRVSTGFKGADGNNGTLHYGSVSIRKRD